MAGHTETPSAGIGNRAPGKAETPTLPRAFTAPRHRVLIIEDDSRCAEGLSALLEQAGYAVAVASDGTAGLDRVRIFAPDVIVCDICLPGNVDGHAVARSVRGDPALRTVCLIALTGNNRPGDEGRARRSGFDAYLTKPANLQVLNRLLADLPTGAS